MLEAEQRPHARRGRRAPGGDPQGQGRDRRASRPATSCPRARSTAGTSATSTASTAAASAAARALRAPAWAPRRCSSASSAWTSRRLGKKLQSEMRTSSGKRRKKATKRLRVVEALRKSGNAPRVDGPHGAAGHAAGPAPDGAARRRPLRHVATSTTSTAASSTATTASSGCWSSARRRSSSATRSACCRRPSTR